MINDETSQQSNLRDRRNKSELQHEQKQVIVFMYRYVFRG